jgi:hypothetical protein
MARPTIPPSLGEYLFFEGDVDEFDIDMRVSGAPTFLSGLAMRPGYLDSERGGDRGTEPLLNDPFPTQGEVTCEAACSIPSGVPECTPATDDCCQGGASIIPISEGALSCDCPETAFCPTADCGTADCGTADCGTADCGTADCGTADCGTADCGTADCGGGGGGGDDPDPDPELPP